MAGIREHLYRQLHPPAWRKRGFSPINKAILGLVSLSILAAVLESEPTLRNENGQIFFAFNLFFAAAFAIEYVVRLWAMGAAKPYGGLRGRIRYALTYASLIDLMATTALWLDVLVGVPGTYGVLLRLVRVLRVMTLTRHSQWAIAVRLLGRAIAGRSVELTLSFAFAGIVLLLSSVVLFAVEGQQQPEAFGSIPRAMWWAVATLTTVGYGDVYPFTTVGKFFAGFTALTAIAIVALPTGIMAAAFSDAFQKLRDGERLVGDATDEPQS